MASKMPPPRPYRDFLTPALHKRFTNAALLTLGVCYVEAIWVGEWDIFWQWFPIGPAGVRTLLLFGCVINVFILRIAQVHIGPRTTTSQVNTLLQYLLNWPFQILNTAIWYCSSAWLFGEVYIWSASQDANLALVDTGKAYERPKLNERPIFLRSLFLLLGLVQTAWHLYHDYDRVRLPEMRAGLEVVEAGQGIGLVVPKMRKHLMKTVLTVPLRTAASLAIGLLVYWVFLRQSIWSWMFAIAKTWYSLPKTSRPGYIPFPMLGRAFVNGTLLLILWECSNLAFDLYVAQPPLKKGSPLTDSSTDPNHSLVAGLRAKKEVTRNFAFWELLIITHNIEPRRRAIFRDINRPTGSIWSQILVVCLGEVNALSKRIQDFQIASAPPTTGAQPTQPQQPQQDTQIQHLPRISAPLKQDQILAPPQAPQSRYERAEQQLALATRSAAQSLTQSPTDRQNSDPLKQLRAPARKLLTQGADAMLSQETQDHIAHAPTYLNNSYVNPYLQRLLHTPLSIPFRQTQAARATAVLMGAPYGSNVPLLAAISSLANLARKSLKEDTYGIVSKDVATIVRTFIAVESNVVRFVSTLQPHWTDVDATSNGKDDEKTRQITAAEEILRELREGLKGLINEFGEFVDDLRLTAADVRAAKEAVMRGAQPVVPPQPQSQPQGKPEQKRGSAAGGERGNEQRRDEPRRQEGQQQRPREMREVNGNERNKERENGRSRDAGKERQSGKENRYSQEGGRRDSEQERRPERRRIESSREGQTDRSQGR